jgi:hypothetical protein
MWLTNTNVYRAHVHGGVDGIKTFGNVLIEDSYIHGMQWFRNDPNQGGGETHNDGVQSWNGPPNTTLRHNKIDMRHAVDALAAGSPLLGKIRFPIRAWNTTGSMEAVAHSISRCLR